MQTKRSLEFLSALGDGVRDTIIGSVNYNGRFDVFPLVSNKSYLVKWKFRREIFSLTGEYFAEPVARKIYGRIVEYTAKLSRVYENITLEEGALMFKREFFPALKKELGRPEHDKDYRFIPRIKAYIHHLLEHAA